MFTTVTYGYFLMGALFGFTAGISPGPLLTIVITETITHNKRAGIKVAIAPLITDLPIITIAFFVFSRISQFSILMSLISFLGGIFLVYLGYECLKTSTSDINLPESKSASLSKGIIANILNPHPYLFWVTVGTPMALKAYHISTVTVILYFISFYSLLVGSKIGVALIVDKTKTLLTGRFYTWIIRILGLTLFMFAAFFFYDSIKSLIK
jgi:threonine/homoserine/homoserine lactone efflux protein